MEILLDKDSAHFVFIGRARALMLGIENVLSFRTFFQEGAHPPPTPSLWPNFHVVRFSPISHPRSTISRSATGMRLTVSDLSIEGPLYEGGEFECEKRGRNT